MQTELNFTFYQRVNTARIEIEKKVSRWGESNAKANIQVVIEFPGDLTGGNQAVSRMKYIRHFLAAVCAPYLCGLRELSGNCSSASAAIQLVKSHYKVIRYRRLEKR